MIPKWFRQRVDQILNGERPVVHTDTPVPPPVIPSKPEVSAQTPVVYDTSHSKVTAPIRREILDTLCRHFHSQHIRQLLDDVAQREHYSCFFDWYMDGPNAKSKNYSHAVYFTAFGKATLESVAEIDITFEEIDLRNRKVTTVTVIGKYSHKTTMDDGPIRMHTGWELVASASTPVPVFQRFLFAADEIAMTVLAQHRVLMAKEEGSNVTPIR